MTTEISGEWDFSDDINTPKKIEPAYKKTPYFLFMWNVYIVEWVASATTTKPCLTNEISVSSQGFVNKSNSHKAGSSSTTASLFCSQPLRVQQADSFATDFN
ncbi:hypothetical protein LA52FAK_16240 [Desulforhopalus sp. 52FAK]